MIEQRLMTLGRKPMGNNRSEFQKPKYSQQQIADALGVPRTWVHQVETRALRKLARALKGGYQLGFREDLMNAARRACPEGWAVTRLEDDSVDYETYRFAAPDGKSYLDVSVAPEDERLMVTDRVAYEFFNSPIRRALKTGVIE